MLTNILGRIPVKLYQVGLTIMVGLILGASIAFTSPFFVIAALIIAIAVFLILKKPIISILGIVILDSTILYGNANLSISLGIGHIYLTDILLMTSLILILVRAAVEPDFKLIHTPLDLPILLFVGVAWLSTFIAIATSSLTLQDSLGEMRVVANYLVFFIVTNFLREEKELRFLIRFFLLLATVVSIIMIAQFFAGTSLSFLPGRVETLQTQDTTYVGITRVLPPGQSLVLVMGIAIMAVLVLGWRRQNNILIYLQACIVGLGIIISFNRSFWVMTTFALILLAYLTRKRELSRLLSLGFLTIVLALLLLFPVQFSANPQIDEFINATLTRLDTLMNPSATLNEPSLRFREIENQYVLPQVVAHPILGLGLGAEYRPQNPNLSNLTGYIHNAHFWIMMKTGLLGYLFFLWFSIAFLIRSFKYWRLAADVQIKAYMLSFALTYLSVFLGAIVNPMFMQSYWTPLFGIMFGFNEVVICRINQKLAPTKNNRPNTV